MRRADGLQQQLLLTWCVIVQGGGEGLDCASAHTFGEGCGNACVTRHTSHVTRHTSHVTQGKACDSNVVEMRATGGGTILAAVQQLKADKAPALAAHRLQVLA